MKTEGTILSDFTHPAVAVDLAMVGIKNENLVVLLTKRNESQTHEWALPGGFVHIDRTLEQTAANVLKEKANMSGAYLEQLASFGALTRDPRGRVISIVYFAITTIDKLQLATKDRDELILATIQTPWTGEVGGAVNALDDQGNRMTLAFDHAEILGTLVKRLRGKLDYTSIAFKFLPPQFTLREVQQVHEAILGRKLTKPAFRRKLIDKGLLEPTGTREAANAFRPAELYEIKR